MTTKDVEVSSFLRFMIRLQIPFTEQLPNVVSHHSLIILSLVEELTVQYVCGIIHTDPRSTLFCS